MLFFVIDVVFLYSYLPIRQQVKLALTEPRSSRSFALLFFSVSLCLSESYIGCGQRQRCAYIVFCLMDQRCLGLKNRLKPKTLALRCVLSAFSANGTGPARAAG